MSNRTRGVVLIAVGALLALISLAADPLGLGAYAGFGWKQILGTLAAVGAIAVGLRDMRS